MEVKYYMLEINFEQQLTAMESDLQFFKNILKDLKSDVVNSEELTSEVPNYNQIVATIDHLEVTIKVLKDDLRDNTTLKNKALMDRFNNLRKFAEVQ